MMTVVPDPMKVGRALEVETRRVAELLSAGGDPAAPVPGLDWTALQAASHLAMALNGFAGALEGTSGSFEVPVGAPARTMPEFLAAANAMTLTWAGWSTLAQAAHAVQTGGERVADVLRSAPDMEAELATPWYGPGMTRKAGTLAALAVTETLVHGYDIAGALRRPRPIDERSALTAAGTVMSQMLPLLVNPELPTDFAVRYGIRLRKGESFVIQVERGKAWTTRSAADVDCVISLTARASLLVGFRRVSLARAVLTGSTFAYGRRPWLGMRFGSVFLSA